MSESTESQQVVLDRVAVTGVAVERHAEAAIAGDHRGIETKS